MARRLRKHRTALVALAVYNFVLFFPVAFLGRAVSPNDVFYNYEPWATYRPPSIVRVQNALLNDPATAYLPLISVVKRGWSAFHWNPYIGSGIPGFGSSSSPVLSPFVLLPALIAPLAWVFTGMILLKINVAFWFAYAWLREERLGKRGAAVGAIVIAVAGVYTVRFLWQVTNATVLYPALLWIVSRLFQGKRTPVWTIALIALAYALAGFPATMAYGAYLAIAYAIFLMIRERRIPVLRSAETIAAVALAILIAAPSLVPFIQFINRSGYLGVRETFAANHYPAAHWMSFFDPQRLGNPALKNWIGDQSLGFANNFLEATIYLGLMTLPLAVVGMFRRRQRHKWFWFAAAAVILAAMFGLPPLAQVMAALPGFKYTALTRTVLLLPVPIGFLAAAGTGLIVRFARRRIRPLATAAAGIITVVMAADLGVFAGEFHPYLEPAHAEIPRTPVVEFLQNEPAPFRFVGLLTYLWPNAAEMYEIQDVASHFYSEASYRRVLSRIDPKAWSGTSTVIQFSSLSFKFTDPLVSMLGVRYFLEHRAIDIVKWSVIGATVPAAKETGAFKLSPGSVVEKTIQVGTEPFWAIELPVSVDATFGAVPRLEVELSRSGAVVWSRSFTTKDIEAMSKVYVPLRPYATAGDTVSLRIWTTGMRARLLTAESEGAGAPLYYGRVTIPIVFDRELPDGRVFRNLAEIPRFHAVSRVRKMNEAEMLATPQIDFASEAVITDDPVFPPDGLSSDGSVELVRYSPAEQRMTTSASGTMFLASSEKLTPELRVEIDGKPARPIQINALFAGVVVPAGRHDVVFSRRIGRGWWPAAACALIALAAIAAFEVTRGLRRR